MIAGTLTLQCGWGLRLGIAGPDTHYTCITCGTSYPQINNFIRCNGAAITLCPWCRADSAPWKHGRGL